MLSAMVSSSVTRISASSTVRGDPIGPPEFCGEELVIVFEIGVI